MTGRNLLILIIIRGFRTFRKTVACSRFSVGWGGVGKIRGGVWGIRLRRHCSLAILSTTSRVVTLISFFALLPN